MNSKKKSTSKRSAPQPLSTGSKPALKKTASKKVPVPGSTQKAPVRKAPARTTTARAPKAIPKEPIASVPAVPQKQSVPASVVPTSPLASPAPAPSTAPQKLPAHLKVPAILLEDDRLPASLAVRFAPAPQPPLPAPPTPAPAAEPEPKPTVAETRPAFVSPPHFGTRALYLLARDPFTLFADWDFSADEIVAAQRAALRGQVLLRIFRGENTGPMVLELPVDSLQRHEFIPAPLAGTAYHAVIGLVTLDHAWHELARSNVARTPHEAAPLPTAPAPAAPVTAVVPWTAAHPPEDEATPAALMPAWIRHIAAPEPVAQVLRSHAQFTPAAGQQVAVTATWSPAEAGASERLAGTGSDVPGFPSPQAAGTSPSSRQDTPSSLSIGLSSGETTPSPVAVERDFWFKVNAEVVIYGSTERDATVTIEGRPIRLKPDGSFSFRFSLPDGAFTLPIRATAADGFSPREAVFHLSKATERSGEVGTHPQDPALQPPLARNAVPE